MQKYTRLATNDDLEEIMLIIDEAKAFLKNSGSPQWQAGYPNDETIINDIKNGNAYVFIVGSKIAAYAAVVTGVEPTYQKIVGAWHSDDTYSTIHRLCFSSAYQGHGFAKIFLSNLISVKVAEGIHNFRVDTHKLNIPMQTLAEHNGFVYRGIIQVDDKLDPRRIAYELNL